jgi:hypothetical protein
MQEEKFRAGSVADLEGFPFTEALAPLIDRLLTEARCCGRMRAIRYTASVKRFVVRYRAQALPVRSLRESFSESSL